MRSNAYCGNLLWQSSLTRQAPIILGYRKSPPDATLNFHPFANAVSEWDANDKELKDEKMLFACFTDVDYSSFVGGDNLR